ncbi:YggS family pyridoxal phosphate-dependent enzyme [Allorhodopirellula solitaria]|uniref:Pyridoxal phosphate homeostasis protein n=1 Tax=Allorhodopirellula solitaria TaxID=2527987 RepID=A0A5C5X009_9BACT|nr:YggS family pyridoxal phosphate-dependent enzyme [Allorhodopirellula solitaria]TWT56140.1 Pyridoxal phosphate homeostasis protein [Allorhodopirellula solitaria]
MVTPISTPQLPGTADEARQRIAENWNGVCRDVAQAAADAGRTPSEVRIVGVSKYVDAEITSWLVEAGCRDLGENRPQALDQKVHWFAEHRQDLVEGLHWHQIGHLQRNKVRRLLAASPWIHSIDSERLLVEVADHAQRRGDQVDVLIEVNVSDEDAKTGLPAAELTKLVERFLAQQPASSAPSGVRIAGLMAMAGWGTDPQQARPQFARLRELRDALAQQTGLVLPELSMGMSGDYAAAIAEGATMVRIGSRLFAGLL